MTGMEHHRHPVSCRYLDVPLPPPGTLTGYLLRDSKPDDDLILQDIPADHGRVGLEVSDGDVHGG